MLCLKIKQKYFGYPNTGGNLHQGDIAKVNQKPKMIISLGSSYKEGGGMSSNVTWKWGSQILWVWKRIMSAIKDGTSSRS